MTVVFFSYQSIPLGEKTFQFLEIQILNRSDILVSIHICLVIVMATSHISIIIKRIQYMKKSIYFVLMYHLEGTTM
jgi:hypothetical protein